MIAVIVLGLLIVVGLVVVVVLDRRRPGWRLVMAQAKMVDRWVHPGVPSNPLSRRSVG
jgi:hypothetical protein